MESKNMLNINLKEIIKEISKTDGYYKSFIDNDKMDIGVLYLRPGQEDNQKPHSKDEVYFILQGGNGSLIIGDNKFQIKDKNFYFVHKNTPHKFCENDEEIIAVYFFGC